MRLFYLLIFSLCITTMHADSWEEETLNKMTIEEKIGQLFMIAGYVDAEYAAREIQNKNAIEDIQAWITQYSVGGIAFVGPSTSNAQIELINRYQQHSKYPLLIAQDFEWGLSMRLKDGMRFPKNSTLGALQDNELIYKMGKEIARQARLVGVHMNLSPDLDVNIEPENPVINVRSFGNCPKTVAAKGIMMIRGLQDGGVIASAKHFPGLGDITTDPHLGLPVNRQSKSRLEQVELYPFLQAVKGGVMSIQTDHVLMPAFDPDLPSSLSPRIVQGILKDEMGFQGVVLSGALRMPALTKTMTQEAIALQAFKAGSDMLLMPADLPRAYTAIKQAYDSGVITLDQINERVQKILKLKKFAGLDQKRLIETSPELVTQDAVALKKALYRNAVKLLRDENGLLPIKASKALYVQIGDGAESVYDALKNKILVDCIRVGLDYQDENALIKQVQDYPLVIVAVYPADPRRIAEIRLMNAERQVQELKTFHVHGLTSNSLKVITALSEHQKKIIVTFFGNPFGLGFFDDFSTLIMAYEDDPDAVEGAARLVICRD